jgi:hypothetical protein
LNVEPHTNGPDGYVQNQDGTLNSPTNPAAIGSTIKLFVTGMGATTPSAFAGNIAQSTAVTPDAFVYASWRTFSLEGPNPPETVLSIPGFISSMFQIPLQVPPTKTSGRVTYAGLAGGFVGLYEFFFTVPSNLPNGDSQIFVVQNGITVPQILYLAVQN